MNSIYVIPWDRDFLSGLTAYIREQFQDRFENLIVVFPHRRPRRYLLDMLGQDPRLAKPCLMPRIFSIDELFTHVAAQLRLGALRPLSELDQMGVLHKVTQDLGLGLRGPRNVLPRAMRDFFPWGLRLAALMEEFFQQNVTAANLDHVQDLVMPAAAALLENLRSIQSAYREALLTSGATTKGFTRWLVAGEAKSAVELLAGKRILVCGFHALTGTEEALLRPLWHAGCAEILWHTDPAVADTAKKPHWSCEAHKDWLMLWKARAVCLDGEQSPPPGWRTRSDQFSLLPDAPAPEPKRRVQVTFHQGFDLHSQLTALRKELARSSQTAGYAVVLPDTSMLMPVLHHLPKRDVNVSMGFPLWRSPFFSLLETILSLQDTRIPGGYHWREVIALLRHPLLKFLRLGDEMPLRALFHQWEEDIRQGEKYLDPLAWMTPSDAEPGVLALFRRVIDVCFSAFEDTVTPRAMAEALLKLASLLLDPEHAGGRWEHFLIDAACLARLIDRVIPELHGSAISLEVFPADGIRTMTRELVRRQRVPFEADPLEGFQVLGMLETRLLTFERVFILEATEEVLPGLPGPDPLLPDPLRQSLGLPGARERDLSQAHTFYRLIQGARQVDIFYSSGIAPGVLSAKSLPSRYVEQLKWEEEKRRGKLLKPGQEPLRLITLALGKIRSDPRGIVNTPICRAKLETRLRYRGVPASLLDSFVLCPLAFFYTYLTTLKPLAEIVEDGDPPAFGRIVHEALQEFFHPLLGKRLEQGKLDVGTFMALFSAKLREAPSFRQMPVHSRRMLERIAHRRFTDFAGNSPACTPLELEKRITAKLDLGDVSYELSGIIDRLDQRDDGIHILDYKTGKPKKPAASFWDDSTLWDVVESGDVLAGLALLPTLSRELGSIQMPLYLHIFEKASGRCPANGAFVCLKEGGMEYPLFDEEDTDTRAVLIQERTPLLAGFILKMMLEIPVFTPQPSRFCDWCTWRQFCGQSAV